MAKHDEELPEVLTATQAAELLQMSPRAVREHAKAGRLPCRRVGYGRGRWRFSKQALLDYLATG